MRKIVKIIIGCFALFMLLTAFSGSGDESQSEYHDEYHDGYQDDEWLASARNHMVIVGDDLAKCSEAISNNDLESLNTHSTRLLQDTQAAMDERYDHFVSPEFEEIKNEYWSTMMNFNDAAYWLICSVDETNNGNTEQAADCVEWAADSFNKGEENLKNLNELLEPYN